MAERAFQAQFVEQFLGPIKGVCRDLIGSFEQQSKAALDFVFGKQGILQRTKTGGAVNGWGYAMLSFLTTTKFAGGCLYYLFYF